MAYMQRELLELIDCRFSVSHGETQRRTRSI